MYELTAEQQKQKSRIRTGALVSGGLVALVVAVVAFFVTGGLGALLRWVVILVAAGGLGYLAYRTSYNTGVAKAVCKKCGTAFGIREVERHERVVGTEERREIEPVKPASKTERGTNRVTTWTEEKVENTAIDEGFKCHDRTERTWTTTREKDKTEEDVPA